MAASVVLVAAATHGQVQPHFTRDKQATLQPIPPEKLPRYGTFWSLSRVGMAPLPFFAPYLREAGAPVYLLDRERNVFVVDDSSFDYEALYKQREEQRQLRRAALELGLLSSEEYWAEEGGAPGPMGSDYGPEELWLEITGVTNNYAYLTLHGTVETDWYQLLSKTNLAAAGAWTLGELLQGYPGTNRTDFAPVNMGDSTNLFFRAQHQSGYVFILSAQDAYESNAVFNATTGSVTVQSTFASDVTVYYRVSGTASNGVDYTSLSGVLTIPSSTGLGTIEVHPTSDGIAEGEETVIITLIQTNSYLIAPNNQSRTISIEDLSTVVQLQADPDTLNLAEPDGPPGSPALGAELVLYREDSRGLLPELEVPYAVAGIASNGVDYSMLSGVVTFDEGGDFAYIYLTPLGDNLLEGAESLTITLLPTNTFAIDPNWASVSATIADSSTLVSVAALSNASEPISATNPVAPGGFTISRADPRSLPELTVTYQLTGLAQGGTDYTNLSGVVTFNPGETFTNVFVQALFDGQLEGDEAVTMTLTRVSDNYEIDTNYASSTVLVLDDFPTNLFVPVVTNLILPIGIDYHQPSNSLIVSCAFGTNNFARIYTNAVSSNIVTVVTNWSGVHGEPDEVKLVTVKATANGFTNGDMYFSSGTGIGWLSADGTRSNLNWCILTNSVQTNALLLRGGLCLDTTGGFSNQLIAVTSPGPGTPGNKGIWRVRPNGTNGVPELVAEIETSHLEGAIVLANEYAKWGPWAGKIVTGNELEHKIFTIAPDGSVASFNLGIDPEDFDIILPNHDLYACDQSRNSIFKLTHGLLTNYAGDLVITEELSVPSKLTLLRWDAVATNFVTRSIPFKHDDGTFGEFEHVTFAPIDLPPK